MQVPVECAFNQIKSQMYSYKNALVNEKFISLQKVYGTQVHVRHNSQYVTSIIA